MSENVKEIFRKQRLIAFFVSIGLVALTGLIYNFYTDFKLGNSSTWLFLGVITTFGSAGFFVASETAKEKKVLCIVFKSIAIVLLILFMVMLFFYRESYIQQVIAKKTESLTNPEVIAQKSAQAKEEALANSAGIHWTLFVMAILSLLAEGLHFGSAIVTIDDDK